MVSLAVAFLVAARVETLKAYNFKESMKASSIADAGIEHAKALLREDKHMNKYDAYSESWSMAFVGNDLDQDGDGVHEAKWIDLLDTAGMRYGRYAVTVIDEASKLNINVAGFHNEDPLKVTEGWSTFEVSLNKGFSALGCTRPQQMRDALIAHRYGGNFPGVNDVLADDNNNNVVLSNDGIDNDADGDVDEPMEGINEPLEFDPVYTLGDDEPYLTPYDARRIGVVKSEFKKIENYITAYSSDKNINRAGMLRTDLNQTTAIELYNLFQKAGVGNAEQIAANIIDYRDSDSIQSLIVSQNGTYYGVEGIRINELMVKPVYTLLATDHTNTTGPGGMWTLNGDHYENHTPDLGTLGGIWWFEGIRPGTYYLKLFGTANGQTIGDVKVDGTTQSGMQHGEIFITPVVVADDGRIKITIANAEITIPGFTTYFYKFELLEQPDCEYIELINITDKPVDVGGWTIQGLRNNDLVATIPSGTMIESFDYLVLAVDKNDNEMTVAPNLRGNNISMENTWGGSSYDSDKVVQLLFSDQLSRTDDVLNDYPTANNIELMLKTTEGDIVDRVKYTEAQAFFNRASERDDPCSSASSGSSKVFDQWNFSEGFAGFLPQGTPTAKNENINVVGHVFGGINSDVRLKNGLFATIGELVDVAAGGSWERISLATLEKTIDDLVISALRIEAEKHGIEGQLAMWQETTRTTPLTNWYVSTVTGDEGVWHFERRDGVRNGLYNLNVYGNRNEALSIAIRRNDGSWTDFSPPIIPDSNNSIRYGLVDIGGASADATAENSLDIKIRNESETGSAAFDYIVLSPTVETSGRININTAPPSVLQALPGVTATVANNICLSEEKPFGDQFGLGDILLVKFCIRIMPNGRKYSK